MLPRLKNAPIVTQPQSYFKASTGFKSAACFAGKIVVIGASAAGLNDLKHTAIAELHPGMNVLATAIDNLINGDYLRPLPNAFAWLLLLVLTTFVMVSFERTGNYRTAVLIASASMLLLSVAAAWLSYRLLGGHWILKAGTPIFAGFLLLALEILVRLAHVCRLWTIALILAAPKF